MDRSGVEAKPVIICYRERNLEVERVVATDGINGVRKNFSFAPSQVYISEISNSSSRNCFSQTTDITWKMCS